MDRDGAQPQSGTQKVEPKKFSERWSEDKAKRSFRRLSERVLQLFTRDEVEEVAKACGFYARKPREICAFEFALCCALGSIVEGRRGFSSVWRLLAAAAGVNVARSAVIQRFGRGSANLLKLLFLRASKRVETPEHPEIINRLEQFERVLSHDGSVIALMPVLKKLFPATRTNTMDAAAKLHASVDLVHRRLDKVVLTGERVSELKVARRMGFEANTLYIDDLGYSSYDYFYEIAQAEADFLQRLKSNANPTVVKVLHGVRAPRRSEGMKFQDLQFTDCHDTFDLIAEFPTSYGPFQARVVGRWNYETEKYHCYVTTLRDGKKGLSVEDLATLYSLRWVIELMFKLLKSSCHLDHVETNDPNAMRTHIYASLLGSVILTSVTVAAAQVAGVHPSKLSFLVVGIAAPLIVMPLLFLWLERELTYGELAAMILRTLAIGCIDQNPGRTQRKWGSLGSPQE